MDVEQLKTTAAVLHAEGGKGEGGVGPPSIEGKHGRAVATDFQRFNYCAGNCGSREERDGLVSIDRGLRGDVVEGARRREQRRVDMTREETSQKDISGVSACVRQKGEGERGLSQRRQCRPRAERWRQGTSEAVAG